MSDRPPELYSGDQKVPVPDPSSLTTQQILREVTTLGTLLNVRVDGIVSTNEVRFLSIEREFELVKQRRIEQKQDTESRRVEQKGDVDKSVQAALLAQKEAVKEQTAASQLSINKSEQSTKEQSSQQYATVTAQLSAITDKITDLSSRVNTIEASKTGGTEMRTLIIALVLVAVSVLGFLATRIP
jgi:cobalamin biosynthesis Mg chelatase CobN